MLVLLLVALGAVMIVVAVWLVRATRSDPASLGPLELMGERSWRHAVPEHRSVELAKARPLGAPAPAPMVDYEPADDADAAPGDEAGAEPAPDPPEKRTDGDTVA